MPTFEDQVKPWFETGDYPTQAQFWQMFDWLRWKDVPLEVSDISGLTDLVNQINSIKNYFRKQITLSADGSAHVDQGDVITAMIIDSPNSTSLKIGSTAGGSEIANDIAITGGVPEAVSAVLYAKTARDIYFTGISGDTTIIIIKNTL